ncbi:MAG: cyclic pyranopterin monophosphate synthase MoaC [Verrucomicrobia bacterium]|nr:cyclic pyranopterin monophosphate synthase MoaC [Verrucomicrobiota bacterium]MDA1087740.1 cyclic pyranopterin monophosphate synthase MoaC [Verrucomicrobiota bacterium]
MLSHVNSDNKAGMVDVGDKTVTHRTARAEARVTVPAQVAKMFDGSDIASKKGPVFQTAIVAGTMAAKRTSELIPMCHPLAIENCSIDISFDGAREIIIICSASIHHKTGVEMEALTGASIAALTVYDMLKSVSHGIVIKETRLIEKTGGKSDYTA